MESECRGLGEHRAAEGIFFVGVLELALVTRGLGSNQSKG